MCYREKLKDERWLRKRQQLLAKANYKCRSCGIDSNLTVHHGYYQFKTDPWDYPDDSLWVLCWPCHERAQATLVEIHRHVGHVHPDDYPIVLKAVEPQTHELIYGITKSELAEIILSEKEEHSHQYEDYVAHIFSSTDLCPTRAYELEGVLRDRYPGIEVCVEEVDRGRDAQTSVNGPDKEIERQIQYWCDKWNE